MRDRRPARPPPAFQRVQRLSEIEHSLSLAARRDRIQYRAGSGASSSRSGTLQGDDAIVGGGDGGWAERGAGQRGRRGEWQRDPAVNEVAASDRAVLVVVRRAGSQ
jgi:hypothetical protein